MLWKGNKMFTSIPFPIVEDRPLIAYHPGPHWNYLASWNVMVDNGQPFVLICDDLGPDYPDGGWGQLSKDGHGVFCESRQSNRNRTSLQKSRSAIPESLSSQANRCKNWDGGVTAY